MFNTHTLKIWPTYFMDVLTGMKTSEVRLDDRGFEEMDTIRLEEYDPETEEYTGHWVICHISFIYRNVPGLLPDHVLMSIRPITADPASAQFLPPFKVSLSYFRLMETTSQLSGQLELADSIKSFTVAPGVTLTVARYVDKEEEHPFILFVGLEPVEEIEYTVKAGFQTEATRDFDYLDFDQAKADRFYQKALKAVNF